MDDLLCEMNRHYNKNHGIIFVFDNTANNNKREKSQSCFSSGIIFSLCLNIKLSIQTFFRLVNLQVYLLLHFYFIFHLNQTGHQNAGKPVKIHLQAELNISLSSIPSLSLFLSLSDLDIFCLIYFALGVLQFNRMWIFSSLK